MKLLKRLLLFFLAALLGSAITLIIIGGGFGEKNNPDIFNADSLLLFAHRGIINYYPENSMEGFDAAKAGGFKAVEIDIAKSKDDEFILFHDDSLNRLLGINKLPKDLTLQELKEFKILFNGQRTESKIVSLNEMLEKHKDDFIIYLDMKTATKKDAYQIAQTIERYNIYHSTIVADGSIFFIAYIEYFYPKINTVLEGFSGEKEWSYKFIPKKFKPDYLSGFTNKVDEAHVSWLKKNNLLKKRIVYGVNKENFNRTLDLGIKKMIIDYDSSMTILAK